MKTGFNLKIVLVVLFLDVVSLSVYSRVALAGEDQWNIVVRGTSSKFYETPLGGGTVYNSIVAEAYYSTFWTGSGGGYSFKEATAGAARECDVSCGNGLVVKQEVDLIKIYGAFSFMVNTNDRRVAAAFPHQGVYDALVETMARDVAQFAIDNLPGINYAYTGAQFAQDLREATDSFYSNGNVKYVWNTYGGDVGNFVHWIVEIDPGQHIKFRVISKVYVDPADSADVGGVVDIYAPPYTPAELISKTNLFEKAVQSINYKTRGIAAYTINSDGKLIKLYVVSPEVARENYKKIIPPSVIQNAIRNHEPVYLLYAPQYMLIGGNSNEKSRS